MFDEPDEPKAELPRDPAQRAKEKAEEFCLHAEIAAVFEGPRKSEAELRTDFDPDLAREVQRAVATLAKARHPEIPVVPPEAADAARDLLRIPETRELPTNDYHIHRRPGETMIVRWLAGDEVDWFYTRLQAHFDAAIEGCREDERHAHGWKQDEPTLAYLTALDELKLSMADRYLRGVSREHQVVVLSTLTADELNIAFLAEDVMGLPVAELVGAASVPGGGEALSEDVTDRDRAWFFKLFALRGVVDETERMCFFAFLQKTDDGFDDW